MLDRCPTCGKTTGTLMESRPDQPGLLQILRGESTEAHRIMESNGAVGKMVVRVRHGED